MSEFLAGLRYQNPATIFMADIPLRILFNRLAEILAALALELSNINNLLGGSIQRVDDVPTLRAHTSATLPVSTVLLAADIQGSPGIFYVDNGVVGNNDGVNYVTDASARNWVRLQAPT